MKAIAIILASYMMFLTVQPVIAQVTAHFIQTQHACCKTGHCNMPANQAKSNCCTKDAVCSACPGCGCCFVFQNCNQVNPTIAESKNSVKIAATANKLVSSFIADCFQPPEIA